MVPLATRGSEEEEEETYQPGPRPEMAMMGAQPMPTRTSRPVRSRPRRAATADALLLEDGTRLLQHWGEVGGVTGGGGVLGVAAARVCNAKSDQSKCAWWTQGREGRKTYDEHRSNDEGEVGEHVWFRELELRGCRSGEGWKKHSLSLNHRLEEIPAI